MHKDYKIWWDEENEIVRLRSVGVIDETTARIGMQKGEEIARKHNAPFVLADTREFEKMTAGGQKVYSEELQKSIMKKVAFLVKKKSRIVQVINIIAMRAKGIKIDSKFFESEKEAIDWLKDG